MKNANIHKSKTYFLNVTGISASDSEGPKKCKKHPFLLGMSKDLHTND